MDFVAYNEIMICDKPIKNELVGGATIGYSFQVKYPSYRGCWLSCLERLTVEVDGVTPAEDTIYFCLNGKEFTLAELPELCREYWYINRPATIRVIQSGGIAPGKHTVRVLMRHRVPYTGYFGQYLTLDSDGTQVLGTV